MENFGSIRKALELHKKSTEETREANNTDHYRVDRSNAERYFALHPEWQRKIKKYFQHIHSKGETVVYVDICGRASGDSLGADKTYCFSLKTPEMAKVFTSDNTSFIDGDIFNSKDFSNLLDKIEEGGVQPALVTFEPIVGLQAHTPDYTKKEVSENYKEATYQQLEKRLVDMIEILKPGGYVYLSRPFQFDDSARDFMQGKPVEEWSLSLQVKRVAGEHGCTVEVSGGLGGPYFLIKKLVRPKKKA
jgi:hypothetical protein